jgi:hypothetical protein
MGTRLNYTDCQYVWQVHHVNGPNLNNSKRQHHALNSHLRHQTLSPKRKRNWQSVICPHPICSVSQSECNTQNAANNVTVKSLECNTQNAANNLTVKSLECNTQNAANNVMVKSLEINVLIFFISLLVERTLFFASNISS